MQFGLINAPGIFQKYINNILGEYLDKFVIVYLNDIIIYLITKEKYREYIKQVLRRLQKEQILVAIKKCEFFTRKIDFIRFIIKLGYISIDLKKVKAIVSQ